MYWMLRALVIGSLALYLANPAIQGWSAAQRANNQIAAHDAVAHVLATSISATLVS
jgi:hypothetical protein